MTIAGFTALYGALAVVEVMLMLHFIRKGPYAGKGGDTAARPVRKPAIANDGMTPIPAE